MPIFITRILKALLVLLIPILLIFGSARLLSTDAFLAFEYGKASFPPDVYGFTTQQRMELASTNLHYVLAHLPDDALSSQTLNGSLVYSQREATHMVDVRTAFQLVWRVWWAAIILLLITGFFLWQKGGWRELAAAIKAGGILTIGLIGSIALLALFAWQVWFDNFHLIFFEPGSWLFAYSDTLIRLFPLQFWMDATLTISLLSFVVGLLMVLIGWQWRIAIEKPSRRYRWNSPFEY